MTNDNRWNKSKIFTSNWIIIIILLMLTIFSIISKIWHDFLWENIPFYWYILLAILIYSILDFFFIRKKEKTENKKEDTKEI